MVSAKFVLAAQLAAFVACALCAACSKKDSAAGNALSEKYPADIVEALSAKADKFFAADSTAKEAWIARQCEAYGKINAIVPEIAVEKYSEILKSAEAAYPDDFVARLAFVNAETSACGDIEVLRKTTPKEAFGFAYGLAKKKYPDSFRLRKTALSEWLAAYKSVSALRTRENADVFDAVFSKNLDFYAESPASFAAAVRAQLEAKRRIDNSPNAAVKNWPEIKREYLALFGTDFVAAEREMNSAVRSIRENPKGAVSRRFEKAVSAQESSDPFRDKATALFRTSIFTKRCEGERIAAAALVRMHGRDVIVCGREFVPEKFPAVFSNSSGEIKCSKAYVARDVPVLILIPDSVPAAFKPLEIEDEAAAENARVGSLFMIAPHNGGIDARNVKIFSAENLWLNLSADTSPHVEIKRDLKTLSRYSSTLMVKISERADVGDNAIVIDAESGKFVSFSVRKYNPGVVEWTGKTGSVIGHESAEFPDFATFVRQFDGVSYKAAKPDSSIRFVRMSALTQWDAFDMQTFNAQKDAVRRFTDDNNDFLMFFKKNLFGDALRSRRLGAIAEKFRKPLVEENLGRDSYERAYRQYMIAVMYAMRYSKNEYMRNMYSFYRSEMEYQMKLRNAMSEFLSKSVRDDDIVNIMHTDLVSRFKALESPAANSAAKTQRLGGSIGGGF